MSKKIYVGNLPYQAGEEALKEAFAAIGEVQSVKIITDESGRSKGFGFVEMASDEDVEKAITALNGSTFMSRSIVVNEARPQTDRGRGAGTGRQKKGGYGAGRSDRWR
ncbi:MAG: RNA-binding protein [Nitrospirae bacterium]|nr:RNA-binding protein [Nitrospirota bacterium]